VRLQPAAHKRKGCNKPFNSSGFSRRVVRPADRSVTCSRVLGLWVGGAANLVGGSGEIVVGVLKLNIGTEQEPVGAGSPEGIPTLPAFTRVVPIIRSNSM
jgi:hypothetical protein